MNKNAPWWFQHLDNCETPPTDRAFQFRELRLPKIPPPYRNYEPPTAPAITMFATDIRPQRPADDHVRSYANTDKWTSPETDKRAAHIKRARRTAKRTAA